MQFKRLQSKNGTSDLINKLEVVIDDDENYLVQIILMYDNCNNNIETLKNKVDKRYKNNQKFYKKDYFNLFLKYNDLFNKLKYHYDNLFLHPERYSSKLHRYNHSLVLLIDK